MFRDRIQFYAWVGILWLGLWVLNSFLNHPASFVQQSINETWRFVYIMVVNLIFFEYSLPLIRKKRPLILLNILIGIFLVSFHLLLVSFGLYGWRWLGLQLQIYTILRQTTLIPDGAYHQMMYEVSYQAQGGVSSTLFFGLGKLIYDNYKLRLAAQQLKLEMQESELNYLKSQTNPHFLFNTLNNIYSLARDKSDLAHESIMRLSKILRFMLYETGGAFIKVEQEMDIIRDYIDLEKLRYDDSLRVNCVFEIDDMEQPLPPLLLMPLVENAFKHGVSETRNHPYVEIHLSISQQQLRFVVENSTEIVSGDKRVKENIGLSNLRRQLELLYTDYHLDVQQGESVFTATLKINLASYV